MTAPLVPFPLPVPGQPTETMALITRANDNALRDRVERVAAQVFGVSADRGDASVTVTPGTDAPVQVFATALTVPRTVTLATSGVVAGAWVRVVRAASATGASALNVGTGPLKALSAGQWCDVAFDGTAWRLIGFGSL